MTPRPYELTEQAGIDIEGILEDTATKFGLAQVGVYADLLDRAIQRVAEVPDHPSTTVRPEIGDGVRSYHVELVAGRRGAASHLLYYMVGKIGPQLTGVIILRVLHEHMEPKKRVISAIENRS